MSLNEFIRQNQNIYPFHMPGHKRNRCFLSLNSNALERDITEIQGADNLHGPTGLIKKIQAELAALYKSEESFLMVNGSSGGITAAIMSVCGDGDNILVARNSHISVFNGLIMSGAAPVYVNPKITELGFCLGVEPGAITRALNANENIKAVVVTSPTYEGVCSDIKSIARVTHEAGALLIVDEAHGAHFGFHDYFPASSVGMGADIVINSLHKTMPVLTQTSALHVCGDRVNRNALRTALSMTQTSSPSYILISAAEEFIQSFSKDAKIYFDNYVDLLYPVREILTSYTALSLLELGEIYDRSKLLLYSFCELDGQKLENIFRNRYGLEMEMSGRKHVLALTSVADTREGFERLKSAVKNVNMEYMYNAFYSKPQPASEVIKYECRVTPRAAYQSYLRGLAKDMAYKSAAGETAAGFVTVYPPGIPLLAPGEIITTDIIEAISRSMAQGMKLYGIIEKKLKVIPSRL